MPSYWALDTYDLSQTCFVLLRMQRGAGLQLRPEYETLACSGCGRVDELKALRRGVSPSVKVPSKAKDIFVSDDSVHIISTAMREVLEGVRGCRLKYFEIPSAPDYWAIWASKLYFPAASKSHPVGGVPVTDKAFKVTKPACDRCLRPREVTFRSAEFRVPQKVALAAAHIERRVASLTLIISDQVKEALTEAEIRGWRVTEVGGQPAKKKR